MENKIAIKWNCYKGFNFYDALKGINEAGFKYLEIPSRPNNTFGIYPGIGIDKINEIKEAFKEYNICPIAMGSYVNILDNKPDEFEKILKFSNIFDINYIVISVDDSKSNELKDTNIIVDSLNLLVPLLDKYNKTLVIELHGKYCNGEILSNICDKVNSSRVKINYDTANAIFYGLLNNDELIKDIDDHIENIAYFHLKEKLGKKNEWNFPALGQGYVPFKEILTTIRKHNNESIICTEIEFTQDGVKDINEVHKAVKDSALYLNKLGYKL